MQEELRDILPSSSVLLSIAKQDVFVVPDNYFHDLEDRLSLIPMQCEIEVELNEMVNGTDSFAIPDSYFDSQFEQIQTSIYLEQFKSQNQEEIFKVPVNYFDDFNVSLPATTKRITFMPKQYWQLGIAASFVLIVGLFVYLKNTVASKDDCNGLACVEKHEIINSVILEDITDDDILDQMTNATDTTRNNKLEGISQELNQNEILDEL